LFIFFSPEDREVGGRDREKNWEEEGQEEEVELKK
jgi:hypothetical protein